MSASLSYEEAAAVNKKALGKGLTKQAFAIFAKIREVDELISSGCQSRAYCP